MLIGGPKYVRSSFDFFAVKCHIFFAKSLKKGCKRKYLYTGNAMRCDVIDSDNAISGKAVTHCIALEALKAMLSY